MIPDTPEQTPPTDRPAPEQPATDKPAPPEQDWRTILRRLGPAGPLAILAAALPAIGGFALLASLPIVGPWLRDLGDWGVVLYIVGFAVASGLAILPTYAQAILGGWAFGFAIGFPAALTGFGGGALIGYAIAYRATGQRVVQLISEKPRWRAVYDALLNGGFLRTLGLVTLIRVPLNSPFAITNLVMAATRVPLIAYLPGTIVGMAPRTAAAVIIAAGLEELTEAGTHAHKRWLWIGSIVVTLVIVAIVGHIANRAITSVASNPPESTDNNNQR